MIALDTNILVYAHRSESDFHPKAAELMRQLLQGNQLIAIPWPCLHEFYSVVTNPRVFGPPTPIDHVLNQMDAWISSPAVALLSESGGYWMRARPLLEASRVAGGMVYDAKIAALCIENGISELWTVDRDFTRFPGLKSVNPLLSLRVRQRRNGVASTVGLPISNMYRDREHRTVEGSPWESSKPSRP